MILSCETLTKRGSFGFAKSGGRGWSRAGRGGTDCLDILYQLGK